MPIIHNPFNEEDLKAIRDSQQDPLVQYYIVRKSLEMSDGKLVAQAAHAAYMFAKYHQQKILVPLNKLSEKEKAQLELVDTWEDTSFTKIAKKASDTKFNKIKEEFDCFCVRDAGKTEVPTGSETVLVLFPMLKSETPDIIWKLRNL